MKNYQSANVDLQYVNPATNYPKEHGSLHKYGTSAL